MWATHDNRMLYKSLLAAQSLSWPRLQFFSGEGIRRIQKSPPTAWRPWAKAREGEKISMLGIVALLCFSVIGLIYVHIPGSCYMTTPCIYTQNNRPDCESLSDELCEYVWDEVDRKTTIINWLHAQRWKILIFCVIFEQILALCKQFVMKNVQHRSINQLKTHLTLPFPTEI